MRKLEPALKAVLEAVALQLPYLDNNFVMDEGCRCALLLFNKEDGKVAVERIAIPTDVAVNWDENKKQRENRYRENALRLVQKMKEQGSGEQSEPSS